MYTQSIICKSNFIITRTVKKCARSTVPVQFARRVHDFELLEKIVLIGREMLLVFYSKIAFDAKIQTCIMLFSDYSKHLLRSFDMLLFSA